MTTTSPAERLQPFVFQVPPSLLEEVRRVSREQERSIAATVRLALRRYLDEHAARKEAVTHAP
jgi:hypothetical protein